MPVDFKNDLILVTCASGKQCSHLMPLLLEKFKRLKLQVDSKSSLDRLREMYPSTEIVQTDLGDPHAVSRLVSGVTALYLVGPPLHPREADVFKNVVDSAVAEFDNGKGRFKHFIYRSVEDNSLAPACPSSYYHSTPVIHVFSSRSYVSFISRTTLQSPIPLY